MFKYKRINKIKNLKEKTTKKTVALLITLIFIVGAFSPVVNSLKSLDFTSDDGKLSVAVEEKHDTKLSENLTQNFKVSKENNVPLLMNKDAGGPWWNTEWGFRKEIIINHSKIDSNLTNFPVLIYLPSDPDIAGNTQNNGNDLVFTDNSSNKLNHEIELYNNSIGHLIAWVNITSISSTKDTIIYLYYGNHIVENQENIADTWDKGYVGVWHMNETSGTTCYDSTSYNLDGIYTGTFSLSSSGIAGYGVDFDQSGSNLAYILGNSNLPGTDNVDDNGDEYQTWCVEGWINLQSFDAVYGDIFACDGNGKGTEQWPSQIWTGAPNSIGLEDTGCYATSELPTGKIAWVYYVGTCDGINSYVYFNGTQENTDTDDLTVGGQWIIANKMPFGEQTDGLFDEIRVSSISRNSSWINTTYNNIISPFTFFSIGEKETILEEPILSHPSPENGHLDVPLFPTFHINVVDAQGDHLNILFLTNSSGSWTTINSNISVGNGTYYCYNTSSFDKYKTRYWWSVNATDGIHWTNNTYTFTTIEAITVSNPYPDNYASGIPLTPILHIDIRHANIYQMNITWKYNDQGNWYIFGINSSVSNGTYYQLFNNASTNSTTYEWRIEVNDGQGNWDNQTYKFTTIGECKFAIITHDDWYDYNGTWNLHNLADWHNQNDTLITYVIPLSDIFSNSSFWINGTWGDGNINNPFKRIDEDAITDYEMFNDSSAKIRNYLRYANHDLKVKYALLVGDTDSNGEGYFPVRYVYARGEGAPADKNRDRAYHEIIPTDVYYACLNGTFNADEDVNSIGSTSGWGENALESSDNIDECDWEWDVSVGRFPVDSVDELSNAVRKTIAYMNLKGNETYLYNITLAGHYGGWGGDAQWCANYSKTLNATSYMFWYNRATYGFNPDIFKTTIVDENPNRNEGIAYTDSNARAQFNKGCHIWYQGGHGGPSGWTGGHGGDSFYTDDIQTIINNEYTLIYSAIPCNTANFDNNDDCFIEQWLTDEHGAFASIGNTRYGWGSYDGGIGGYWNGLNASSHYLGSEFFDAYFNETYSRIGDMLFDGKKDSRWWHDEINEGTIRWAMYEQILMGSPAIEMQIPRSPDMPINDPIILNSYPLNNSYNQDIIPALSITITDHQGDRMNITWKTNTSGYWDTIGFNYSVLNGTYYCYNTSSFNKFNTRYWWSVNITDGNNWTNNTYTFTTIEAITISNPYPDNNVSGISLTPILHIDIRHPNNYQMNITWKYNDQGNWYIFGKNSSVSNGTYYQLFNNASQKSTTYEWRIEVNDGHGNWKNQTYQFTTIISLDDFSYYKKITINHSLIDENLENFPILFDNISSDFTHAQPDGDDFIFVKSDNSSFYNHEIESFNESGSNRLIAWVNITNLSSTEDTVLWLYYGNIDVMNQQNKQGTWNSDYIMVQHFNETTGSKIYDSTSNMINGTKNTGVNLGEKGIVGYCVEDVDTT